MPVVPAAALAVVLDARVEEEVVLLLVERVRVGNISAIAAGPAPENIEIRIANTICIRMSCVTDAGEFRKLKAG